MGFSKDFLWGGATAANQYEGGVFEGGAGLATADVMTNGSHTVRRQVTWKKEDGTTGSTPLCFGSEERHLPEGAIPCLLDDDKYYYPSHIASDFYHHYKEDIKLCAEEGFKCFRLSIKWSRIFPNGDDAIVNEEGVAFYKSVMEECKKYGIEPLVTLSHYETPLSLAQRFNGWNDRKLVDMFVRYAETCFDRFEGLLLLALAALPAAIICYNIGYLELTEGGIEWSIIRFLITFCVTSLLMALMILIGIWFPARQAIRIQPAEALREE